MEDAIILENESGSMTKDCQQTTIPDSLHPFSATMSKLNDETFTENQAVSMESKDCSSALSSPAEACPPKPAATPQSTMEATKQITATSNRRSASDSSKSPVTGLIDVLSMPPLLTTLPFNTFGSPDGENDFPTEVIQKNVTVTLECNSVWKQFHSRGTEMILTKQGRRMFPYCRYHLSGLEPEHHYRLFLSIYPSDPYKHRWNWATKKWETFGLAENQTRSLIQAYFPHNRSLKGSDWMSGSVSFYKLKLTNNCKPQDNRILLNTMHRYIPMLHVIPVLDGDTGQPEMPIVLGPDSMTFIFPQTEFMAVTCYQNSRITQLKIQYNPFARGFKKTEDNQLLNGETDNLTEKEESKVLDQSKSNEETADLSAKTNSISSPPVQQTRLVLKPFMSTACGKDELFVSCMRGKHALGELILVEDQSVDKTSDMAPTSKLHPDSTSTATSVTPSSSKSTTRSSPGKDTKRKLNVRKHYFRGALTTGSSTANNNPTVSLQPELDDVEGHVFVSFNSKKALEVHLKSKPAQCAAPVSPPSPVYQQQNIKAKFVPESDEEIIASMQAALLRDLKTLRHRQVIHPVLQKVGLKLNFINSNVSIDLQYLGVDLPLPPAPTTEPTEHVDSMSLDKELPFISRTGKTSDVTKIKGWKHKYIKGKETSANCVGLPKNLSAFCSDMLDEYLESEAKKISERAEAFSTNPEASVAYELPAKSSSYVKTLDSVLKNHCKASDKPCPLSYKSQIPAAAPPSSSETYPVQSTQERISSRPQPESSVGVFENEASGSGHISDSLQRSFQHQDIDGEKPALSCSPKHKIAIKPLANTKVQLYLSQMEFENLTMGRQRTELTSDRVEMALSTIVSKEMVYSKSPKQVKNVRSRVQGPKCGQDFCILGCVCSSLQHQHKPSGSPHCRRPDCMLKCHCLKGIISQQLCAEQGNLRLPTFTIFRKIERAAPCPKGSHTNRLWIKNINDVDSEPLFVPTSSQNSCVLNPSQLVQEKDKDPVYKYLESKMTCARVRAFNSKPPPEVTLQPKTTGTATNDTVTMHLETSADNMPNSHAPKTSPTNGAETDFTALEKSARKQIQIQSQCKWDKDKKAILKVLCLRLCENKLTEPFLIGPYNISPISKIFMRTPSNSIVTYKVQISKPSETSKGEDTVEEKLKGEDNPEKEVTPFLSGVLLAGILRARTKTPGSQTNELIEVNNKFYNQANVLLGGMGALHPANRLAAFVTGRLNPAAKIKSQATKSTQQHTNPVTLHADITDRVVQTVIGAKKTTDLDKKVLPLATSQPVCGIQSPNPNSQHSQCHASINPGQSSSVRPQQSSQGSSPFLLTVSDSLKTPNFLRNSGTYSFRICPPSNQTTTGQNRSGVALPGGFTLFQIPKQEACEAPKLCETVNTTNTGALTDSIPLKQSLQNLADNAVGLDTNWLGLDSLLGDEDVQSSRSPELGSSLKLSSDDSTDELKEVNVDLTSGDDGSDISDYSEEDDEDEKFVNPDSTDIANQEMLSRYLMDEPRSSSDFGPKDPSSLNLTRTLQLKMLERLKRRNLQRSFDELQAVIGIKGQTSRVVVLERAARAINNLDQTSMFLEKKKEWLMDMNALYVKQLSLLSGKSEVLILEKINQICRKQEIEEKKKEGTPFFSKLLQSRAALLQSTLPESEFEPPPPIESNLFKPPCEPITDTATEQKLRQMMASFQADRLKYQTTAKKFASFWEKNRSLTGGTMSDSNSAVNSGAANVNSTQMSPALPVQPFSLPLVRSKAGRIILPSFMKPVGNTVLRIQLVQSQGDVESQPSNVDAKNQENSLASESVCKSEEDKSTSTNSDVKFSRTSVPMITFDQSVLLKALETVQNKEKGITTNVCSKSPVCLPVKKLNSVNEKKNPSVDKETPKSLCAIEHSPKTDTVASDQPDVKRGRGRPRKHPRNLDSEPPPKKRSPSLPKDDRPVKIYYQSSANEKVNAAANSSRPLTRGALGKDFPSTKKRSWIDLEKELELDLD